MVPSQWFSSAERYLTNPKKAEESFRELLEKHPEPKSLLDYLNERRFILLLRLLDHSECMRKFLINHPTDFQNVIPGLWYVSKRKEDYLRELEELVSLHSEDKKFSEKLAYYRHRELMRLLSKEFLGTAKLEDILREYSELPDALLELAYRRSLSEAIDLYGEPLEEDQKPATACIIGLGKLGSYELNYYSDIDVMFIHSSDKGRAGKLTMNEFFGKVFQKVVSLMTSITPEGKPYEVDLDLRPFGKSGPISMSLRSAELYYESYGRMWERFALLRARYSAGDQELYRAFERKVKEPFVFRKSIDYRVLEEIRLIKAQINAQAKKGLLNKINVKTGEGGIREVEFMVQAMVLLFGGKFPFLRESNTIRALWKLHQKGVFSMEEVEFLESAYVFLRKLEHRIQMKNCVQNHAFSPQEAPLLAKLMDMEVEEFQRRFQEYTKRISQMFYNLLPAQEEKELDPLMAYLLEGDQESGKELLASLGFKNPTRAFNILLNYVQGSLGVSLSSEERRQFYELLPQMVKMMASTPDPDETLNNFDKFFSNPTGRRVILSSSKEDFRTRLCKVFSLSSYLSTLISRNPDLVEDVLTLYQDYPDQSRLEEEFEKYRERLPLSPENLFRRFKTVWEVRNALVYLVKQEDRYTKLEKFFLSLSELADFLMKKLWQFSDGVCLYALGKYGSQELTIGSDLDLVFVARSPSFEEVKLAQQMIKFITLHTSEGYLYKLDFRLRPMGSKGELLPSIDFYRDYFEKNARTWERIAWTRARFIVGDTALRDEFEEVIENFLFSKPITEKEIREIRDMRFALESNAKKDKELIDIKFGKGGLIDGEFLIQLYILREKLREPSMIRAYRVLAPKHSLLKEAFEIYMFLRLVETRHRLSKEHGGSVLNKKDRERVASSINMSFEDFEDKLRESLKRMREIFLEVFEV
ncbi:glutamine-synthetase adenylyltransferase [Thermocrinis sp.]|jgi:glutamate-ammonia-ligase adenylyltransferase|uniref:[protein-PII] uridylyltransferase family protein n=1 Tax=Thermocrinis sp. TaxID=2024383 RepID=UPI00261722F7|nr:glutamine-synthetase adenylyltransferase [Thermocrinis sp.]